jgi:4-aminobutyrate aminotransferase-like enzyme
LDPKYIKDIRGIGMEIGLELNNFDQTFDVISKSFDNGLLLMQSGESIIQIMPPLTTSKEILEEGIEIIINSVNKSIKK